jgi:hypothetical protein
MPQKLPAFATRVAIIGYKRCQFCHKISNICHKIMITCHKSCHHLSRCHFCHKNCHYLPQELSVSFTRISFICHKNCLHVPQELSLFATRIANTCQKNCQYMPQKFPLFDTRIAFICHKNCNYLPQELLILARRIGHWPASSPFYCNYSLSRGLNSNSINPPPQQAPSHFWRRREGDQRKCRR